MITRNSPDPAAMPPSSTVSAVPRSQPVLVVYEKLGTLKKPVAALILTSIALLIYWPVLFNQFQLYWDDHWVVMNEYTEKGLALPNLWKVLTEFYHGQYAPVNEFSYIILYSLFGYSPFWFHLVGLCVHLANICLIFYFIDRLQQMAGIEQEKARRIAFFTALLMAVHPFLVESVAWVSASKIILYVLFYLIGLNAYLSYLGKRTAGKYGLVLLCFVLSFGAKEQAVVFPVCLLLVDYVTGRSMKDGKVWQEKIPLFLLALCFGLLSIVSQEAHHSKFRENADNSYPFYQNVVFAFYCLTEYLSKCFLPINLTYLYPFPIRAGESLPLRFWMYPGLVLLAVVLLRDFWKQKWVFFGIAFFFIHIAVTLHIIPISRFTIIADRYVYLSAAGAFFLTAILLEYAITKPYRAWAITGAMLYCLVLGVYTHQRVRVWYNSDTLKKEMHELLHQQQQGIQQVKK